MFSVILNSNINQYFSSYTRFVSQGNLLCLKLDSFWEGRSLQKSYFLLRQKRQICKFLLSFSLSLHSLIYGPLTISKSLCQEHYIENKTCNYSEFKLQKILLEKSCFILESCTSITVFATLFQATYKRNFKTQVIFCLYSISPISAP